MGMVPPSILRPRRKQPEAQPKQEHLMAEELEEIRRYATGDYPVGRLRALCDPDYLGMPASRYFISGYGVAFIPLDRRLIVKGQ